MAYTETTTTSWFSRLGSSFGGIGLGIVLIIAGTILLWWNEGSFVGTGDALREAQSVTRELGDISKLDNAQNGQLVHATGLAATQDRLSDPIFGLSINAIRLERTVGQGQWVERSKSEKKTKIGGEEETVTTYTYEQQWVDSPVDSGQFRDPDARTGKRNLVLANLENFRVQAANVTFGAYRLPEFLISSISGARPLDVNLPEASLVKLSKQLASAGASPEPNVETPTEPQEATQMVHVSANTVLLGVSPTRPQIGDVRVTFKETKSGLVSILAKLNGDTFETYRAKNGKTVSRLAMGTHSLENMYGDAHASNAAMTWILRVVGAVLVIFGLKMILAPLVVLASVIPLLGSLVGAGTGIVGALLGLAWSLAVIAIAWLRFRPAIGLGLLAVAVALIAFLYIKGHSRK